MEATHNANSSDFVAGQKQAAEDILALIRRSNESQGNGYGAEIVARSYLANLTQTAERTSAAT